MPIDTVDTKEMAADTPSAARAEAELYLVDAGCDDDPQHLQSMILRALDALPALAMLISGDNRSRDVTRSIPNLVSQVQSRSLATMISNNIDLARDANADGVHLTWRPSITQDYAAARAALGSEMMIGADAGKSRHDAMLLAEAEADYVAFGVPPEIKDQETARARQRDLISWWASVFEVPVVGFNLTTPEQAEQTKSAGADFIAVTLPPFSDDQAQFDAWLAGITAVFPSTNQTP